MMWLATLLAAASLTRQCPAFPFLTEQGTGHQPPHPAVARIVALEAHGASALGSGTLVEVHGDYGLVVTNWHVVRSGREGIFAVFPDGFCSPAQPLKLDRDWDLAALMVWRPSAEPVPISRQAPRPGEWLTIAGYGSGRYRAVSGRCTQYVSPGNGLPFEMVEVSAQARKGDSGGPIFNERGELAGVLFGAGWGTTSGSYAGRVHWFLADARQSMRDQGPAPAPPLPPVASPPESVAATTDTESSHPGTIADGAAGRSVNTTQDDGLGQAGNGETVDAWVVRQRPQPDDPPAMPPVAPARPAADPGTDPPALTSVSAAQNEPVRADSDKDASGRDSDQPIIANRSMEPLADARRTTTNRRPSDTEPLRWADIRSAAVFPDIRNLLAAVGAASLVLHALRGGRRRSGP
jgi:hypothetical protein